MDNTNIESEYPECYICKQLLSDRAIEFFQENDFLIKNGICDGYLCEMHWCSCMPRTTPWSWIRQCRLCAKSVCKSCRVPVFGQEICRNCSIQSHKCC